MICPKCLAKTNVINTRDTSSNIDHQPTRSFLKDGYSVFGWWSEDFEVRLRVCSKCKNRFKTIEVTIDDLNEAFKEASFKCTDEEPKHVEDIAHIELETVSNVVVVEDEDEDEDEEIVLPELEEDDRPKLDGWRVSSNLCFD